MNISTQPDFKSIIDHLLSFETCKIRINHNVTLTYSVIDLNKLIDFDLEPQLTARVEQGTVNKGKISPKQNYLNLRSPLVLHEY